MTEPIRRNPTGKTPSLVSNWVSIIGIILAASSFFAVACLMAIDLFRGSANPYMGILTYIVAPAFLVAGLALTAIGALWERRRWRRLEPGEVPSYPKIDFNVRRQRQRFILVAAGTLVFLLLTALGSYRTYEFTESVSFCGETCHKIMTPEFTAYQDSPHARVECVRCHIGPGATWFVKSKLSGVYQVYATISDKYPRPIPTPVEHLRPAQETCEQCHWPQKFYSASEWVSRHYLPDERNSAWMLWMLLKVGGGDPSMGMAGGIHLHMNIANEIEYICTDRARQVIPWVRITGRDGRAAVYESTENPLTPAEIAAASPRRMDCIDCHNRPSHIYNSPVKAVNLAIASGRIDPAIPYIKRQAVEALARHYGTTAEARGAIGRALTSYYREHYPERAASDSAKLDAAVREVQSIYAHDFFPDMKVDWRVYPDNIGHMEFEGCFRCHDGAHVSAEGDTIAHGCGSCHTIIAQGPGDVPATVALSGLEFEHPVDISEAWREMKCTECHDGALVE